MFEEEPVFELTPDTPPLFPLFPALVLPPAVDAPELPPPGAFPPPAEAPPPKSDTLGLSSLIFGFDVHKTEKVPLEPFICFVPALHDPIEEEEGFEISISLVTRNEPT